MRDEYWELDVELDGTAVAISGLLAVYISSWLDAKDPEPVAPMVPVEQLSFVGEVVV